MCISCFQLTDFSALTNEWIRNPWDPAWLKSFYFFFIHSSDTGPGRTHECCNMLQISMVLTLSCSCASVNLLILPLHLTLWNTDVNIQPDFKFNSRESYHQLSGEDQAIMVWLENQDSGAIHWQNSALGNLWCATAVYRLWWWNTSCRTVRPTRSWEQNPGLLTLISRPSFCSWLLVGLRWGRRNTALWKT